MARQYINDVGGKFKLPLKDDEGKNTGAWLIWGDPVRVIETKDTQAKVRARGRVGWIPLPGRSSKRLKTRRSRPTSSTA